MNSISAESSKDRHMLFTYGTLKKGQPNYYHIQESGHGNAKFIGHGRTSKEFPLVVATRWNLPFLLHAPGKGHIVHGDVYEVDSEMMTWMDEFEGHPDAYQRMKTSIIVDSSPVIVSSTTSSIRSTSTSNGSTLPDSTTDVNAHTVDCWVYFFPKFPEKILEKELLASYDAYSCPAHEYKEDEGVADRNNIHDALLND